MDRNFQRALKLVLKHEGGWADHPKDPGGATMKGVTLATFRRFVKPDATKADLRKISDEQIATVYRREYWDAVLGAELPDGVDYAVFDFAVNSGPGRAAKYLQNVLGAVSDGKVGPATVKAARAKAHASLINDLCDARLAFLKRLETWPTFGKGWSTRVKEVRSEALKMVSAPISSAQPETKPDTVTVIETDKKGEQTVTEVPKKPEAPILDKKPNKFGIGALLAVIASVAAGIYQYFFGG